jgi:hypothetical protein
MQDTWSPKQKPKGLTWRLTSLVDVKIKNIVIRCVWMFEFPLKL